MSVQTVNGKEVTIEPVADLRGADLRWADLRGADLRWANLTEANLTEANLEAAKIADGWIITKAPEEAEPEKVDAS